ncbi:MAG: caspase family protein [Bacteroidia bacterium]
MGVQNYKDSIMNLTYSAKDIRDLANIFSKKYPGCILDTLIDKRATKENILKLKNKLLKTNVDDKVIISLSGHGLLSDSLDFYYATYDIDFRHPENHGLLYDELESLLDSIPARNKLLLLDACHSGEVDKEESKLVADAGTQAADAGVAKGVRALKPRGVKVVSTKNSIGLQNSFELMQQLFTDLSKGSGAVVISAAGGKEYAFEADKWNNGVFTYSVLKCFEEKGITSEGIKVSELKDYVIEKVSSLTNGQQKPTSRKENLVNDFRVW